MSEAGETKPKRSGAAWGVGRIFRWGLILFGIGLAALAMLIIGNALRPVSEPAGLRPDHS